jgi:hypothetical protein
LIEVAVSVCVVNGFWLLETMRGDAAFILIVASFIQPTPVDPLLSAHGL